MTTTAWAYAARRILRTTALCLGVASTAHAAGWQAADKLHAACADDRIDTTGHSVRELCADNNRAQPTPKNHLRKTPGRSRQWVGGAESGHRV